MQPYLHNYVFVPIHSRRGSKIGDRICKSCVDIHHFFKASFRIYNIVENDSFMWDILYHFNHSFLHEIYSYKLSKDSHYRYYNMLDWLWYYTNPHNPILDTISYINYWHALNIFRYEHIFSVIGELNILRRVMMM